MRVQVSVINCASDRDRAVVTVFFCMFRELVHARVFVIGWPGCDLRHEREALRNAEEAESLVVSRQEEAETTLLRAIDEAVGMRLRETGVSKTDSDGSRCLDRDTRPKNANQAEHI